MRISGLSRCTAFTPPHERMISNKTLGPDQGWVLFNKAALKAFCANAGADLTHRGRETFDHVCASYGEWAFDAEDSSMIRCVVFMHYNTPPKLAAMLGDADGGNKVFKFTGEQLYQRYKSLRRAGHDVHVWQRSGQGEIALDFCMFDGDPQPATQSPLELPTFIPDHG